MIEKWTGESGPGWTFTVLENQGVQFYATGAAVLTSGPLPISTGEWHQFVAERNGNDFSVFMDGAVVLTGSGGGAIIPSLEPLLIGGRNAGDPRNFTVDGLIDNVTIWDHALSTTQIAQHWNGGAGVDAGDNVSHTATLTIDVTAVNDAPTITSNGAGSTAADSVSENSTAVTTVVASDPDAGSALSYAVVGGADAAKFTINSTTGALAFLTAPNFEAPTDAGGNNVYDVTVQVSDGNGGIDVQAIAVTVTDVDDTAPTVVSVTRTNVTPTNAQTVHYTVTFSEAVTGVDASQFSLATTGALSGASIASVAEVGGSGDRQYTVAVNTGSGDGTVALQLTGAAIHDLAGNALPGGAFNPVFSYPVGAHVGIADLNADGIGDAVLEAAGSIQVVISNGDGTFQTPVSYSAPSNPNGISVGDVNNDGLKDIVASAALSGGVSTFLGRGDGTFEPQIFSAAGIGNTTSSAIADFNADGKADLVVASNASFQGVAVLLGDGTGSFSPYTVLPSLADVPDVAVGDFDENGLPDFVFTNVPYGFGVREYLTTLDTQTGQPVFTPIDIPAPAHTHTVSVGDLNKDGHLDLAIADYFGGISVALGNGNGTFQTSSLYQVGTNTGGAEIADVNGDGHLDLFYADYDANAVAVLLGNGDGTFASPVRYESGGLSPLLATLGDVTGDGRPDAAVFNAGSGVAVLLNAPPAITGPAYTIDKNDAPTLVVLTNTLASTPENGGVIKVADIAITDDALGTNALSLSGADAAAFSIATNGSGGKELWFNGGANFEAKSSYAVTVAVDDPTVGGTPDASASYALTVTNVNEAPTVATSLTASATEDTASITRDLLEGASDPDAGSALSVASVTGLTAGLTIGPDGHTLTIDPANAAFQSLGQGEQRVIALAYGVHDEFGLSVHQTETLTITGVNDTPVIVADSGFSTESNVPVTIAKTALLINDSDVDAHDVLSITSVQGAQNGTVSLGASGVTFTPTAGYSGAAAFTYTVSDGHGGTATASVGLTINPHLITGTASNDTLAGTAAADKINAGAGNDGTAKAPISGGAGNDIFIATLNDGNDVYDGGAGIDTYDLSQITAGVTVDLATLDSKGNVKTNGAGTAIQTGAIPPNSTIGQDTLNSIENVIGGSGNDTIKGDNLANHLEGGGGNDTLTGRGGLDTFVFKPGFGKDVITDFAVSGSAHDVVEVSTSMFADWTALQSHITDSAQGAIITLDANDTITLTGVTKAQLITNHVDDFYFV